MKNIIKAFFIVLVLCIVIALMGGGNTEDVDTAFLQKHYKEQRIKQQEYNQSVQKYRLENEGKYPPIPW